MDDLLTILGYEYPSEGADYQYFTCLTTTKSIWYTVVDWRDNTIVGTYSWKVAKEAFTPENAVDVYHKLTKYMITDELARKMIIMEINYDLLSYALPLIIASQNTSEWTKVICCEKNVPITSLGYDSLANLDEWYSSQHEVLENARGFMRKVILQSICAREWYIDSF